MAKKSPLSLSNSPLLRISIEDDWTRTITPFPMLQLQQIRSSTLQVTDRNITLVAHLSNFLTQFTCKPLVRDDYELNAAPLLRIDIRLIPRLIWNSL
ncbi:hypothetical protein TNIN_499911 [Trichonephila inaurata madagascariensis]|uniref:Uncharacterized protein n=1 Tax=Trichonephila inaurata madagascariensis TaxID=2747483 RepID=A0A8X7CNC3_9ARAC|nr:hypothetical protein TNIN_499911 [Trichonephila inaurata madagascariensis]